MKSKTKYRKAPKRVAEAIARSEVVTDFLPGPDQLVFKEKRLGKPRKKGGEKHHRQGLVADRKKGHQQLFWLYRLFDPLPGRAIREGTEVSDAVEKRRDAGKHWI